MSAHLALVALLVCAAPAEAQLAEGWLRRSLVPAPVQGRQGPSTAIFPKQEIHLRFSHSGHLAAGLSCLQCHDAVDASKVAADRNIPGHSQCETCHDIDAAKKGEATDPPSACGVCHPGHLAGDEVAHSTFPESRLVFSHKLHLGRGLACKECHASIATGELGTRDDLPRMATCLRCHDGTSAPDRCQTCHLSEADGLVRTKFPDGLLMPSGTLRDDDHGRDFLRRHAHLARAEFDSCQACHRQAECEACHAGSSKALRVHPPDFVQTHPVSARGGEFECSSCHRAQGFCVSCHQQTGAAKESPLRQPRTALALQRFHPVGFVRDARGLVTRSGPEHHSFAAQANMASCASCHSEQTCLECHSTTGATLQVSPHPAGFVEQGLACRGLRAAPVACAKCHQGGAGLATLRATRMPDCP